MGITSKIVVAGLLLILAAGATAKAQETVLRVAMTASDIPDVTGQPDQGSEGLRFVGYSLHDSLLLWDLSRSDTEATLKPGLATKWYIDPADKTRWVFELRHNVKFHDGCDFDADVVLWNIDRLTNDKSPQFNPKQFAAMRVRTNNIARAEKVDQHKVAIVTKTVDSLFYIQMSYWMMVSKCQYERAGTNEQYATMPSGTGPYKFARIVPRERLELVRNPDYWDKSRIPKHDRLVLLPMPEATTRAAALLTGQVDFIEAPSPDTIDRLKSAGMQIVTNTYPHNWHYQLNFVEGPFKDKRVRQAANHAINRAEMKEMLNGLAVEGYTILLPSQKHYGIPRKYEFDTAKATELLKQAKCLPCEVTFAISTSGSGQMQPLPMNELVKAQLEAVGFKVKLATMDWNALLDVTFKGRERFPQYHAINVSRSTPDPFTGIFRLVMKAQWSPSGGNWGHYVNDEVETLVRQVYETFDETSRDKFITRIHEILSEDAGMIFVTHDLNPRALSPRVSGFVQAQSWLQDLTPIHLASQPSK